VGCTMFCVCGCNPGRREEVRILPGLFCSPLCAMLIESFGCVGDSVMSLLGSFAEAVQADGHGLTRAAFILRALRKLSDASCHGNALLHRSGLYSAAGASGQIPLHEPTRPLLRWFSPARCGYVFLSPCCAVLGLCCLLPFRLGLGGFWTDYALCLVLASCG
jgi:hypothetical protein